MTSTITATPRRSAKSRAAAPADDMVRLATTLRRRRRTGPTFVPGETVDFAARNAELFGLRAQLVDIIERAKAARDNVTARRAIRSLDELDNEIVDANRGLVLDYVRRFRSRGRAEDTADFEAAGMVGLIGAISTYDLSKGPFGQWAFHPIQRQVQRAVRDADFANLNPGDFERRPEVLRARDRLIEKTPDSVPTIDEVAAEAKVNRDLVRRVLHAPRMSALSAPVVSGEDLTLADMLPADETDAADRVNTAMTIAALEDHCLHVLDPRELFVMVSHYGLSGEDPQTLAAVGDQLALSREAARQIEGRGRAKLLHPSVLRRMVRQRA